LDDFQAARDNKSNHRMSSSYNLPARTLGRRRAMSECRRLVSTGGFSFFFTHRVEHEFSLK
jgi:hypothetical protein